MKSTEEFVADLLESDIRLWLDGDTLRFSAPQGGLQESLRDELKRRKADIVEWLRTRDALEHSPDFGDLSFEQKRIWYTDKLDGKFATANLVSVWRCRGPLDVDRLSSAMHAVIERHEPLRTTIVEQDEQPRAILRELADDFQLPLVDLSDCDHKACEIQLQDLYAQEIRAPFDLEKSPMIRGKLVQRGIDDFVLILNQHHISSDGWSQGILWSELSTFYLAGQMGTVDGAMPHKLSHRYNDYVGWQRARLENSGGSSDLQYWKRQLKGLPTLELPTDYNRPPQTDFEGGCVQFQIEGKLLKKYRQITAEAGATLQMALLALLQEVLSRFSGQRDFAVGVPISGRERPEFEPLIGLFLNTLVLRAPLREGQTFYDLLAAVREVSLEAYEHQSLPFELLIEELNPDRRLDRNPLIQVVFQLLQFSDDAFTLPGIEIERIPMNEKPLHADLEFTLRDFGDSLIGSVVYRKELLKEATVKDFVAVLTHAIEIVSEHPEKCLGELSFLPDLQAELTSRWGRSLGDDPGENVVSLFETRTLDSPDRFALVSDERRMTYRELNREANQLAHHLISTGVLAEELVALYFDRSFKLPVAILAVLKCGGAYLPLDINDPPHRLKKILGNSGARIVISEETLACRLADFKNNVIVIDTAEIEGKLKQLPSENPAQPIGPENLAYVMFTSGTTGVPKGVEVVHRGIVRLIHNQDFMSSGSQDTFLMLASPAFDASTFEIWGALLTSSTLAIPSSGLPSPEELGVIIKKHQVTRLWLTASLFNQIIDDCASALKPLRQIITGGEALSVSHIRKAQSLLPESIELWNGYGPTENTTFTCCHRIPHDLGPRVVSVPIGKPIRGTSVMVLDAFLNRCPIGYPGELYIGGIGLARGYRNDPELTAKRFIQHPHDPEQRLYRTGDRVRWQPDGILEFIGRYDEEIKLRGHRINLGEITAVLDASPDVRACAVAFEHDRIIAFIVWQAEVRAKALRSFSASRLPKYMQPNFFHQVSELPLNLSGKTDVKSLMLGLDESPQANDGSPPETPAEVTLAAIWANLLKLKSIHREDNFFDVGGHSLMTPRLAKAISREFGVPFGLNQVFLQPTLGGMAELLEKDAMSQPSKDSSECPSAPIFWLFSAENITQFKNHFPPEYEIHFFEHLGSDGARIPYRRISEFADYFLERVLEIAPDGRCSLGGFSGGGLLAFEIAARLEARGSMVEKLFLVSPTPPQRVSPNSEAVDSTQNNPGSYILKRLRKVKLYASYLRVLWRHLTIAICVRTGLRVPGPFRTNYIHDGLKSAARSHKLGSFSGRSILIYEEGASSTMNSYRSQLGGMIEEVVIGNSHGEFLERECTELWLNRVARFLASDFEPGAN